MNGIFYTDMAQNLKYMIGKIENLGVICGQIRVEITVS